MKLLWFSWKNIRGSGFRSLAIFLAVMGVAWFLLATTLIIAGAQYSLDSGLKRLGADILVVPLGAETKVETALLMGKPTTSGCLQARCKKWLISRGYNRFLSRYI